MPKSKPLGSDFETNLRNLFNAILCISRAECQRDIQMLLDEHAYHIAHDRFGNGLLISSDTIGLRRNFSVHSQAFDTIQ